MRPHKIRHQQVRTEIINMSGGVNEETSSLEWKGGELIGCQNYQIAEGSYGGYSSIEGYERYDGQAAPSTVPATDDDHTAQDAARTAITAVGTGGTACEGPVLGIHIWNGVVYAFRKKVSGAFIGMFKASGAGWVEITLAVPIAYVADTHDFRFVNHNFYGTTFGGVGEEMFWVDGVNTCMKYNGTVQAAVPNAGMAGSDTPMFIAAHDNRLWLGYAGGSLQASSLGAPMDWATGPQEIGIGRELTNLKSGVGNALIAFADEKIMILSGAGLTNWTLETFSDVSGAYEWTAKRMLGTVYFVDDRGVSSLEASDQFGDFAASTIDQKVKKTIQENKTSITACTVNRELNQFRVFFESGYGVYFSFQRKKLMGATIIKLDRSVEVTAEGEDGLGNAVVFFANTDGYVYQMDKGTSFDGEPIEAILATGYYHYKTPRNWKSFLRLTLEVDTPDGMTALVKPEFDYGDPDYRAGIDYELTAGGQGGRWNLENWNEMRWSGADVNRIPLYINGLATNMSIVIYTKETYKLPHTIQNFITDFTIGGRQV